MKRTFWLTFIITVYLALAGSAYPQCWSVSAGSGSSETSTVPPSRANKYEALLLDLEPVLQKVMGVSSKVYMIDPRDVRADPKTGHVYFGRDYLVFLDDTYQPIIAQTHHNPIPPGMKLIVAHEYAHEFQFRMFKKRNIPLTNPSPIDELQADILGSYFMGATLQHASIEEQQDVYSGATMVLTQLADPFFNDSNHHGNAASRGACIQYGFAAGDKDQFGPLASAMTTNEDKIYDWSRAFAEKTYKNEKNPGKIF